MPRKVNGKWDFSDMVESVERIHHMTEEEMDKELENIEKCDRQVKKYIKEIDPLNTRKRVR